MCRPMRRMDLKKGGSNPEQRKKTTRLGLPAWTSSYWSVAFEWCRTSITPLPRSSLRNKTGYGGIRGEHDLLAYTKTPPVFVSARATATSAPGRTICTPRLRCKRHKVAICMQKDFAVFHRELSTGKKVTSSTCYECVKKALQTRLLDWEKSGPEFRTARSRVPRYTRKKGESIGDKGIKKA